MNVQEDGLVDDGHLQHVPYGVSGRQGFINSLLTQQSIATLYSYTATVPVTTTVTVVSTCIPTSSFTSSVDDQEMKTTYSTTPCAARRRREIWDEPELQESISPSNVNE